MSDTCFVDITVEFLSVAFHNILYYLSVYPQAIFETRKKYSVVVYRSIHPEVNQYIDLCLKTIAECLKNGQLSRIELVVTDNNYKPIMKFVFDFSKNEYLDETVDAYLVQCEQNLRAFCLNISLLGSKLNSMSEDRSFLIHIHTNESNAICIATNPELDEFPLIEVENSPDGLEKIIPIRQFRIRNHNLDTYAEL